MGGAVVITKRQQRTDLKNTVVSGWWPVAVGGADGTKLVLNDRAVFAVNHEHRLLDLKSLHQIGEHGEGIEPELRQELEALWMNDTGILVGG